MVSSIVRLINLIKERSNQMCFYVDENHRQVKKAKNTIQAYKIVKVTVYPDLPEGPVYEFHLDIRSLYENYDYLTHFQNQRGTIPIVNADKPLPSNRIISKFFQAHDGMSIDHGIHSYYERDIEEFYKNIVTPEMVQYYLSAWEKKKIFSFSVRMDVAIPVGTKFLMDAETGQYISNSVLLHRYISIPISYDKYRYNENADGSTSKLINILSGLVPKSCVYFRFYDVHNF